MPSPIFTPMREHLPEALEVLNKHTTKGASIGLIMGTGLHRLATMIDVQQAIPYSEIPHFPLSTVESHPGRLLFGKVGERDIIAMQGRFHRYEGYSTAQICFPVELMHALGVQTLLVSNAAGSLNRAHRKGELMIIDKGFSLQESPFLDEQHNGISFDEGLSETFLQIAAAQGTRVQRGSYVAVTGPMLETRAEYRYLINHGLDAVGMSTIPEVTAATRLGIRCLAVSVLTDECDPDNLHPVTLEEIIAVAGKADAALSSLFNQLIQRI